MKEAVEGLDEKMGYVKKLTDKLVKGIMENIPYSHYTGDPVNRLPGTASFVFEAIEGEGLILRLDNAGVWRLHRFGMLHRFARSVSRSDGDRSAARDRARLSAPDPW